MYTEKIQVTREIFHGIPLEMPNISTAPRQIHFGHMR